MKGFASGLKNFWVAKAALEVEGGGDEAGVEAGDAVVTVGARDFS